MQGEDRWVPQLKELAEPLVKDNFLELYDLSVKRQGGRVVVSVVLDKADGLVSLTDCETVSRDLDAKIEALDVIPTAFVLEVSSPGMDRALRDLGEFERFQGRRAHVVTREPLENQTSFDGRLDGVLDGMVLVRLSEKRTVSIPYGIVKKANLVVEM